MKKIVIALLMLSLSFTAIFAQGSSETTKSTVQENTPIEITFWHIFGDARGQWIEDRVQEFNNMQDKYHVTQENKGNYRDTLQASLLAYRQGSAPTLVHIAEAGSQVAYDSGIFKPISEIGAFDTSDYIEPVLNYYTINGKVNSIPFNSSSPVLYINTDMLVQAGYDRDWTPNTFSDVIESLEKAQAAGITDAKYTDGIHAWFFEELVAEQGGYMYNNGNGRDSRATEALLGGEAGLRVAQFYKDLSDKGLLAWTGKVEDWGGSDNIFTNEKAMYHMTSTGDINVISEGAKGKFDLNVGMLPIASGTKRNGTVIGGGSIWLTKGHTQEEMEGARDFILYMTNTDNMVSWHKLSGYYPVRKSSVEKLDSEGWFGSDSLQTVAFNQLLDTIPNKATAGALGGTVYDHRTYIEEALVKIINGEDVETEMNEAIVLTNAKIKEYNANF
ncbi:MAG: ABC transporter substrate-binding protein [Sphaerochaetaceae bacterium]|nr:ABC transporter substrate-binding protein [Sphaerochaetaceae bacterium]